MECSIQENLERCNCTYPCSRKGKCCECIDYHRGRGELPACYFGKRSEVSYDRSVENYLRARR